MTDSPKTSRPSSSTKRGKSKAAPAASELTVSGHDMMSLEPRILLDAAAVATGAELAAEAAIADAAALAPLDQDVVIARAPGEGEGEDADASLTEDDIAALRQGAYAADDMPESASEKDLLDAVGYQPLKATEVYVVDTSVQGYESLLEAVPGDAIVIEIASDEDGVEALARALEGLEGLDAIHILSHGDSGEIKLGTAVLDAASIAGNYADELAAIGAALGEAGDMLVYGCDFGDDASALSALALATGADIAASTNDTGGANGADWVLEASTGDIEATTLAAAAFTGILADTDGDGLDDSVDIDDDNDGILDVNEGGASEFTAEFGGTFGTLDGTGFRDLQNAPGNGYVYGGTVNGLNPAGRYAIVNQAGGQAVHSGSGWAFAGASGDAEDAYLAVNGGTTIGTFFSETLTLQPGVDYDFSFAARNGFPGANAPGEGFNVEMRVLDSAGNVVASIQSGEQRNLQAWTQFAGSFNTGAGTDFTLEVRNLSTSSGGNDFAIDEINLLPSRGFSNVDTDGDGVFDHQDIDSDNDGIIDGLESEVAATPANVDVFETGSVSLSVAGTINTGAVTIDRPVGATVRSVYVFSADNPDHAVGGAAQNLLASDVTVNGVSVTLDQTETSDLNVNRTINRWGDVTDEIGALIDALPNGTSTLTLSEVVPDASNGVAILIVWEDPNVTDGLVVIDFGSVRTSAGTGISIPTAPLTPARNDFTLNMGLGISHSAGGVGEVSTVAVNGTIITTTAGASDDGGTVVGELWTIGDDFDAVSTTSERYDISGAVTDGDTSIDITTSSAHQFDFIGITWLEGTGIAVERVDLDSDGDGVSDRLDLDSDNDGIGDAIEGHATAGYIDNLGEFGTDADGDGYLDQFDANDNDWGSNQAFLADTDADGTPDYLDLDSDGDGLSDTM